MMTEYPEWSRVIDILYINEPSGSKILAGDLSARFERVSNVTHF